MEGSSYETLEALAHEILTKLKALHARKWAGGKPWTFKIGLEKPIAVPYAEAAFVELRMRTD